MPGCLDTPLREKCISYISWYPELNVYVGQVDLTIEVVFFTLCNIVCEGSQLSLVQIDSEDIYVK